MKSCTLEGIYACFISNIELINYSLNLIVFACYSLTGGLCMIIGLYMVLWGKAQDDEEGETSQMKQHQNNDLEQPLLSEN